MVRAMRMLNAVEAGTTSGAQFETLLTADPGRLAELNVLLGMRGQARRMAASSTAMAAVWASNTATDAVFASAAARLAVYNADTALAALQATPAQVQRKVTSGSTLATNTWGGASDLVANNTKIIILRRFYGSAEYDYINWARGSVTSGAGHGPVAGSGGRTLYTSAGALGCVSGTYASTGAQPSNNDTGNFVCAANGLRRDSANAGGLMSVYYIAV